MVRGTEVKRHAGGGFDILVLMEFGAIVGGDGAEGSFLALDEEAESFVGSGGSSPAEFANQRVLRFPLDERDDAVLVVGTDDGVELPMPEPRAIVRADGPLGDVALAWHDASGIERAIPFPSSFPGLTEL